MKIVCDSCSTKYSISDDKVRGKVFKIRCKKCSHIIVVKGTSEEGNAVSEAPAEPSWHVVIDGEQVGPLGDADVRARLARSEIAPDSYVWKEGFADWQRLADVPDFADVAPAAVAGELYSEGSAAVASLGPASSLEAAILPGNLFGGRGAVGVEGHVGAPLAFSPAGAGGRAAEPAEAFGGQVGVGGGPSGLGSENGDLFGMATPFVAPDSGRVRTRERSNGSLSGRNDVLRNDPRNEARNDTRSDVRNDVRSDNRHDGGRIENLTAQRSENSVLFSLSNLQSLASPGAAIRPPSTITTTDGSGLIDIRAMAASTLGASGNGFGASASPGGAGPSSDDLPAFTAFSSAAPVLLPLPSNSGPPKWVYLVIGSAVLMLFVMVIAAVSILRKPVTVEQAAAPAPVQQPVAAAAPPAAAPAVPPTSKTLAPSELPPREGAEAGGAGVDKGAPEHVAGPRLKHTGKLHKGGLGAGPGGGATSGAGAMVASAPAEPDKPKAAKGSLDDLLEGALKPRNRPRVDDDTGARKAGASGADAPSAGPLSKAAVVAGMNGVKGRVGDCYNQFKVPGMAMVNVNIGKSGKVTSAAVTGKFQGTPTGACVEKAVRTASFPPSDGLSTPYPFNLR
jgi:predicted Zn finger-like uncharacterized protein